MLSGMGGDWKNRYRKTKHAKKKHQHTIETRLPFPLQQSVEPSRLQRRGTDFQDLEIGVELSAFF
jgi:hypothetical protein